MQKKSLSFPSGRTDFYFSATLAQLKTVADPRYSVIITDEHVFEAHARKLKGWKLIVLKAGEEQKVQATVDTIIQQLIELEADRKTTLVGIGGGVVTDITGYVASVYMRGIRFGFVPSSLLALVDASIGGKNGIDVGVYKNMVGVIRQPAFIMHDISLLKSLPEKEWRNGFAEIIKHACIKDAAMFRELRAQKLAHYQKKTSAIAALVQRNALLKARVVQKDETEQGDRRLLNFGHTLGHALENQYALMHGEAVAIGMAFASKMSEQLLGFRQAAQVIQTIEQYGLPVGMEFDRKHAAEILRMDKKRERSSLHYILLEKIGKGTSRSLPLEQLTQLFLEIR
jgi:3-dehydroquinate synthase